MFKDKKSPVDVVIYLDLSVLEVDRMHEDTLKLTHKEIITEYYYTIKEYYPNFLNYYKIIKTAKKFHNKIR